jgi:hypothetical protein
MAANLDFRLAANHPWYVFPVATNADYLILLPSMHVEIKHLGFQDDALASPSALGDAVIIQSQTTSLANSLAEGCKCPLQAGESWNFLPNELPVGADGPLEIKLRAVGNAARCIIVLGRSSKVYSAGR